MALTKDQIHPLALGPSTPRMKVSPPSRKQVGDSLSAEVVFPPPTGNGAWETNKSSNRIIQKAQFLALWFVD